MKASPSRPKRQSAREYLELQRLMAENVMRPLRRDGRMQTKTEEGRAITKVAGSFIKPNDRLTSFERLEIYNRQYWFRLRDCFYDDYPGLRAILGDRRFERMAEAYLIQHPSECFTLRNLGRRLIAFLEKEPQWIKPNAKLALDMARLEWAHIEAFDNEARPPLDVSSLAEKNPARLRLRLQPHLTLLQLGYEVDEYLIKIKQGERLRGEASNAMEMRRARLRKTLRRRLRPKTVFVAVHRHNDAVFYK
ncbi:MAG TPA: DNA-binding domain-containing protein, partial [Verrucomicrobiae bacterium]